MKNIGLMGHWFLLNKSEVQNIYGLLEPQNLNYYKYDGVFYDY